MATKPPLKRRARTLNARVTSLVHVLIYGRTPKQRRNAHLELRRLDRAGLLGEAKPKTEPTMADRMAADERRS
jgi:hypothetical protein